MNVKRLAKKYCLAFFIFLTLLPAQSILALNQNEKFWTSLVVQQPLTEDKRWLYLFFTSMRFINRSHPWQTGLLEGGIGHQLSKEQTIWFGYRFTAQNPNNNFFHLDTLFQQSIWEMRDVHQRRILLRLRLEEVLRSNASPLSFRLRNRILFQPPKMYFGFLKPLIYDEVFLQLNNTNHTSHTLVSENRLFLGFNLMTGRDAFWEVGYINQYLFKTPLIKQNSMDHILSIVYLIM